MLLQKTSSTIGSLCAVKTMCQNGACAMRVAKQVDGERSKFAVATFLSLAVCQEKRNNGSGVCISCSDGGRKGVGGPHESLRKSIHPCPHPHHVTPRDASCRSLYRCCTRGRRWSSSTRERWTLLCLATPSPSNQETTFTSNRLVDTLQYLGILSDYIQWNPSNPETMGAEKCSY